MKKYFSKRFLRELKRFSKADWNRLVDETCDELDQMIQLAKRTEAHWFGVRAASLKKKILDTKIEIPQFIDNAKAILEDRPLDPNSFRAPVIKIDTKRSKDE